MHALIIWGVLTNANRFLFAVAMFPFLVLVLVLTQKWPRVQLAILVALIAGIFILSDMIE